MILESQSTHLERFTAAMMNCHTIVRTKLAGRTLNPSVVLIILTLLAVARGSANVSADDPKSRRSHPFDQREHVVQRMNGEQTS